MFFFSLPKGFANESSYLSGSHMKIPFTPGSISCFITLTLVHTCRGGYLGSSFKRSLKNHLIMYIYKQTDSSNASHVLVYTYFFYKENSHQNFQFYLLCIGLFFL